MGMVAHTICFAHVSYQLAEEYASRGGPHHVLTARSHDELGAVIGDAEFLCISGLWRPDYLAKASKLRLIQATSAGVDQFDLRALSERGIKLCNARGVNAPSVAQHAIALMLSIVRQLSQARDRQRAGQWRGMVADRVLREGELDGKTLVIFGFGTIGGRLAKLAQAFGMKVIGVRRHATVVDGVRVLAPEALHKTVGDADFLCLTCPLTDETRGLVDSRLLRRMKPSAWLINVSRGPVVVEADLIAALQSGAIAGAALDCFEQEPLPSGSPLWVMDNVIVTPHSAGETNQMERHFIDLLLENIRRMNAGDHLLNEINAT